MSEINIEEFIKNNYKIIIAIFLILIFVSRIYGFGSLPLAVHVDEAGSYYDSYSLANYGVDRYLNSYPLYLVNYGGGQSVLYTYLNVLLIKIAGFNSLFISRLPELILFLMAIFISYKLVDKKQNKTLAILFTFLLIICPWHIINSRRGLDCNLLGPIFILGLYILENAKKNYHYIIAGLVLGLLLYTYSLAYIILPIFLLIWTFYHVYTKTINIKQILILYLSVFVVAIPLIYFVLLNMGVFNKVEFGIFTIPKLNNFRNDEITLSNIWNNGILSLKTIFLSKNTLYYIDIPFFLVGIYVGIKDLVNSFKKKEYSFNTVMLITFLACIISIIMLVKIGTTNRANILYIFIVYFTAVGILKIIKNKKILWIVVILIYLLLFIIFEVIYYKTYVYEEHDVYEDIQIGKAIDYIKDNDISSEKIYLYTYRKSRTIHVWNYKR